MLEISDSLIESSTRLVKRIEVVTEFAEGGMVGFVKPLSALLLLFPRPPFSRGINCPSRADAITRVQKECDEETVKDVMAGKVSPNAAINIDSLGILAVSVVLFAWCRFWSAVQRTPQPQPL